jgi:hypothetical protein
VPEARGTDNSQPNAYTMETSKTMLFIWNMMYHLDKQYCISILHLHLTNAKVHSMSVSFRQVPSRKLLQNVKQIPQRPLNFKDLLAEKEQISL